jgi:hypothetical protein
VERDDAGGKSSLSSMNDPGLSYHGDRSLYSRAKGRKLWILDGRISMEHMRKAHCLLTACGC